MQNFLVTHLLLLLLAVLSKTFALKTTPDSDQIAADGFTVKAIPKEFKHSYKNWELLSLLGRGAVGTVFLAWNQTTYGAIKLCSKTKIKQDEWEKEVENSKVNYYY